METKYYYVSFWRMNPRHEREWDPVCYATDKHPFEELALQEGAAGYTYRLMSWQEITKEEYERYKQLGLE